MPISGGLPQRVTWEGAGGDRRLLSCPQVRVEKIADALEQGADIVITQGATQSNHARQTAAAAAKTGLECLILLEDRTGYTDEAYTRSGNVLLDHILGAPTRTYPGATDMAAAMEEVADELRRANLARVDELHPPVTPRDSFYTRHGKRALDVAVSGAALLLSSPVVGALCLVTLKDLGRPVLFTQKRPGQHGKMFRMVKLRTMREAYDDQGKPLLGELRVTKAGRLIRRADDKGVFVMLDAATPTRLFAALPPGTPLGEDEVREILTRAADAAAITVSRAGADLPRRSELEALAGVAAEPAAPAEPDGAEPAGLDRTLDD